MSSTGVPLVALPQESSLSDREGNVP